MWGRGWPGRAGGDWAGRGRPAGSHHKPFILLISKCINVWTKTTVMRPFWQGISKSKTTFIIAQEHNDGVQVTITVVYIKKREATHWGSMPYTMAHLDKGTLRNDSLHAHYMLYNHFYSFVYTHIHTHLHTFWHGDMPLVSKGNDYGIMLRKCVGVDTGQKPKSTKLLMVPMPLHDFQNFIAMTTE